MPISGWKKDARVLYDQLANFIREAKNSVLIQTPYFVTTSKQDLFSEVLKNDIKVNIMTNSLYATDNLATSALSMRGFQR